MGNFQIFNRRTFRMGISNPVHEPVNTKPSLTVPGMALSVQEIERRYVRGDLTGVQSFQPVYNDDIDFGDFEKLDEMERIEYARQLAGENEKLAKKLRSKMEKVAAEHIPASESPEFSSAEPEN